MSILSASGISKNYGVETILEGVSFNVNKGDRIGIVGSNGAGKSTLMKIIAGELACDGGELFKAADLSIGYLKQRDHFSSGGSVQGEMLALFSWQIQTEKQLAEMSGEIAELSAQGKDVEARLESYELLQREFEERRGYSFRGEIKGILSSLAFPEDYLEKSVDLLSGGERTRLALAALLLQQPDLLLLDEPTNHLDIGTLKWLEGYLRSYKGSFIVISHDRYFLDKCVSRIFEIERRKLSCYEGNYSAYKEAKELRYQQELKRYELAMEERARQEEIIRRFKEHNTEHLVKRAQSREKKLAREEMPEKPEKLSEHLKMNFDIKLQSGNDVVRAEGLSMAFGYGERARQLFENVSFDIKRGERICIVGANGIGKTTLLRIILGELEAQSGKVTLGQNVIPGYYDQEQQNLCSENTVLEELHSEYIKYDQRELRSLLGCFLFKGDDVFKQVRDLAGGERARLSLLKLMMSGANLLIMDEPTNHLDIGAKEIFEDALMSFPGTMIIVSHDRYLLSRIPTAIFELGPGGIETYLGTYDYYSEKSRSIAGGKTYLDELSRAAASKSADSERDKRSLEKQERIAAMEREKKAGAEARKKEKLLAAAEERIKQCAETVAKLEEQLCLPEVFSDAAKAAETAARLEDAKKQRELCYEEWLELNV